MVSKQLIVKMFSMVLLGCVSSLFGTDSAVKPATPNASPEARALLKLLYDISGKYILTGQHNYPNVKGRNTQFAAKYIGKTPVIFSTDWGFAGPGDTDSYLARPDIVEEAIHQHRLGSIVTICWHAVPPTADEPVTFRPNFSAAQPESLSTVQGQLTDQQFKDILTPGTWLNKHWQAQVDTIAVYLKKLQDAHVPILWRPYHEMNGDWFWWGGRGGENGTSALYRQLFDRLVKHHKINNLIWIWSMDRPNKPEMNFTNFFPGPEYLDVLGLDVYRRDFKQAYYDSLIVLSNGKPMALAEVGNPPTPEILTAQPKWAWYSIWAGMVRGTSKKEYNVLADDPHVLYLEDPVYREAVRPYRAACGLDPLPVEKKNAEMTKADFSGEWIFNEDRSVLDNQGAGNLPYQMKITQKDNELTVQKSFIVEWGDDRITEDKMNLDGRESKSEFWNSPRITTVNRSEKGDSLIIKSKVTFNRGGQVSEMVENENWSLQNQGKVLSINQYSSSFWGERKLNLIFDRREVREK
jgi:mannan endo-1,4-beta-mannosidase